MGDDNNSGYAERIRQHGNEDSHRDSNEAIYIIDRAAFNQGINAKYDMIITEGGVFPTLVARGPHAVAVPLDSTSTILSSQETKQ